MVRKQLFFTALRLVALGYASLYHFSSGFKVMWGLPIPAHAGPTVGALILQTGAAMWAQWLYCLVGLLLVYAWCADAIKLWHEVRQLVDELRSTEGAARPEKAADRDE
jgi:hypothetical protein